MNIEASKQKHQKQQQQQQQQQQQHQHHAHCSYDKNIVCDDAQMHKQKHQHHSHQPHHSQSTHQLCEISKISENLQQPHHHHQQQKQQQQHSHHTHRSRQQQQEQQQTSSFSQRHQHSHQNQNQAHRKHSHSHSPHHSRHTSPHSHHSYSLHSSPHQSQQHMNRSSGGGSGGIDTTSYQSPTQPLHSALKSSNQSQSSGHAHHHHHHRRRSRRGNGGNGNGSTAGSGGGGSGNSSLHGPHGGTHSHGSGSGQSRQHTSSCSRRHRSATDVSSVSLNTCHNENCVDREVQEIFVRKSCCSGSRTELAQFFAEDLYGSASRRPSSCCTSSDYCYQTDSTSLYGSRSSLSRNNSIKSASISMRKRRAALHQRQPSYTSISLRDVQSSQPHSTSRHHEHGLNRQRSKSTEVKHAGGGVCTSGRCGSGGSLGAARVVLSPSKVTIERQTSKDALSQELPDYACSPSPIRWSFLADDKTQSDPFDTWMNDDKERKPKPAQPRKPCRQLKQEQPSSRNERGSVVTISNSNLTASRTTTPRTARRRRESAFSCGDFEESSTTVLFHQEGEAFNNCCNNYIQCNTYLDQDLQITSEDIHQYLSKGNHSSGDILNNTKNYPFQPSNALEFHYKNNFANNNGAVAVATSGTGTGTNTTAESEEGAESVLATNSERFKSYRRHSSKETNLNQNFNECSSTSVAAPMPPQANINLSSSTNNINIILNSSATSSGNNCSRECNGNEVKFINTTNQRSQRTDYRSYDCANVSSKSCFDKQLGIDQLPKEFEASTKLPTTTTTAAECAGATECSSSDGQHSSPLPSPVQTGVSFESFDAPSDHNLISQRESCQFSSPTIRSPLSPGSPAGSSLSNSVNPAAATYEIEPMQHQQQSRSYYDYESVEQQQTTSRGHQHHHHHHHHHYQQHHHQHSPSTSASTAQRSHHGHSHHATNDENDAGDYYHHQHQHHQHQHHHRHHHANDSFKLSNALKKVRRRARKYTDFLRKK